MKRRVDRLEARTGAREPVGPPRRPTTLDEIRAIEAEIARIENEMRAAGMSEAEIRAAKSDEEPDPDEVLRLIEQEVARLKAERE
jgi:hypothetical protein